MHLFYLDLSLSFIITAPPRLSIKRLPRRRSVECTATNNWKPDLELCWITKENETCQVITEEIFIAIKLFQRHRNLRFVKKKYILANIFSNILRLSFQAKRSLLWLLASCFLLWLKFCTSTIAIYESSFNSFSYNFCELS